MSRPPINPEKTVAGISVDPQTLDRVIPESRRPDGTVRKQIKIRPGFTPQEDVRRFRGTKQAQMDANVLPKGHIIGWAPPPSAPASSSKPLSKSAKKNAKRKEKREKEREDGEAPGNVPDNWDDEDDEEESKLTATINKSKNATKETTSTSSEPVKDSESHSTNDLVEKLEKLDVK